MDEPHPSLIAGTPDLRYLKVGIASKSKWSPDSLENLARLEVLEIWNADHLGLGDGHLVRSKSVKVIVPCSHICAADNPQPSIYTHLRFSAFLRHCADIPFHQNPQSMCLP